MIAIHYHAQTAIRRTRMGATCYHCKWYESPLPQFKSALAGTRNRRGTTLIWARRGESFDDAIARRTVEGY